MFTGLVEGVGRIKRFVSDGKGALIEVSCPFALEDASPGDSIAVDGACLTVEELDRKSFTARLSPETLSRTTFKYKKIGDPVNLERALRLGDRLGGHLVSGHVDGVGKILEIQNFGEFFRFKIEIPERLSVYLVEKGSIAIDGISLTINACEENVVELMIIPHTLKATTLQFKKIGDPVNIEIDMIAKMVYKWMNPYLEKKAKKGITLDFLKEKGFF